MARAATIFSLFSLTQLKQRQTTGQYLSTKHTARFFLFPTPEGQWGSRSLAPFRLRTAGLAFSRVGVANQKSTASAALFRFFGERERPETAPKTRLFDRLTPLVASFRTQGGFGRGFVGVGRPNSVTPQNSRARPRPVFLPRPRGRRPTSRAVPRPTTLRLERQVAGLRVGARHHGGSVSYRPKT